MRHIVQRLGLVSGLLLLPACSMMGPEAKVTMAESEIKSTKSVGNVVIVMPDGAPDASGKVDKTVLASAAKAFGGRARPATAVNTALKAAGAPAGLPDALLAPYQASFAAAIKDYDPKKEGSRPKSMELPATESEDLKLPKKLDAKVLKGLMAKLKAETGNIKEVGAALGKGDTSGAAKALANSKMLSPLLAQATLAIMDKLKADHVLFTQVIGDEAAYNSGKEVRLVTALVNIKTGKFRFFAEIQGKKEMGMPYFLYVGNMASKAFEGGAEQDPALAEESSSKAEDGEEASGEEGKTKKKGKKKKA